jgi:hypothetical protein
MLVCCVCCILALSRNTRLFLGDEPLISKVVLSHQEQEPQPEPEAELKEIPQEEVLHQYVEPQADLEELPQAAPIPAPAPLGSSHLYKQLM